MNKLKIPKALREQVWLTRIGTKYSAKCATAWCANVMTVFDFQCGHDIPESKGGLLILENLYPICSRCNLSMSNTYTFKEWNKISSPLSRWKKFLLWINPLRKQRYAIKAYGIKSSKNRLNPNVKPILSHGRRSE